MSGGADPLSLPPEHRAERRPMIRPVFRFALYAVSSVFLLAALSWLVDRLGITLPPESMLPASFLVYELTVLVSAFLPAYALSRIGPYAFGEFGLPWRKAFRGSFWQGVAWGLAMAAAMMLLIWALGGYSFGGIELGATRALWNGAVWALVFLLVGVAEEFLFRGYSLFTLSSAINFWTAAAILSALFALSHIPNPGEKPFGVFQVFLIGMFFCLTLRRTGDLWFAIGAHAAFDWSESFLYSVPDSGAIAPGHLLHASLHGPDWLTGGSTGPEGSVMALFTIVAAFFVFSRVYRPREQ